MENKDHQSIQQETQNPVQPPSQVRPITEPTQPSNSDINTRSIIAILLLLFFYPIGLIFMFTMTKWPKWVKLLISVPVILVILVIILTLFLITKDPLNRFQKSSTTQEQTTSITPFPTSSLNATNPTTNWKTYSSKSYLVKYPSTWIVENQINKNDQAIRIFNPSSMKDGYGNGGYTGTQVATEELLISTILSYQTTKQFIDSIAPSTGPLSLYQAFLKGRKTLVINGFTAEIYPDVGEGSTGDNIILNNNSGVLVNIHVVGNYNLGILQQILSTFKFT